MTFRSSRVIGRLGAAPAVAAIVMCVCSSCLANTLRGFGRVRLGQASERTQLDEGRSTKVLEFAVRLSDRLTQLVAAGPPMVKPMTHIVSAT